MRVNGGDSRDLLEVVSSECQSDGNSSKPGCGSPVKAQASARVDVPTAPFSFAVLTKESNACTSFCANAWMCICQGTDRDLEIVGVVKKMNDWICTSPTTDHDPASDNPDRKRNYATMVFLCGPIVF